MRRLTRVHIYINIYIFALFLLQRLPPPSLSFKYSFQRNIQPCTCICICNGVQILYWNNVQTTDHIIIHHSQCCQLDMNNQAHLLLFQISQYRPCVFEGTYLLHVFNTVFLHVIVSCTLPQDTWTWSRTCNQKHHTAVQCLCAVYACVCVCVCACEHAFVWVNLGLYPLKKKISFLWLIPVLCEWAAKCTTVHDKQ